QREMHLGDLSPRSKLQVVQTFRGYLLRQATALAKAAGTDFDISDRNSGAAYVLRAIGGIISRFHENANVKSAPANLLD
ncbi:MAG: hypothetical protein ACREFZ_06400, partial [Acetobacteraceae bacterium]